MTTVKTSGESKVNCLIIGHSSGIAFRLWHSHTSVMSQDKVDLLAFSRMGQTVNPTFF